MTQSEHAKARAVADAVVAAGEDADEVTRLRAEADRLGSLSEAYREHLEATTADWRHERLRAEAAEAERDALRAEVERWTEKAQEAGAAYANANSKHHAEMDRANRLERLADTLAEKAVDLEDRARAAEAERGALQAEVEHWKHHAWEAGEGFKRAIESESRAWAGRRAAEAERDRPAEVVAQIEALHVPCAEHPTCADNDNFCHECGQDSPCTTRRAAMSGPTPAQTPQNGPEPTWWRDFLTGAQATLDRINADRAALSGPTQATLDRINADRAALSGPTPAETHQNGPEPALSRDQGTSGQSGEGEALRGAEKGEEAGR